MVIIPKAFWEHIKELEKEKEIKNVRRYRGRIE
jgi:hypothetical protein